MTLKALSNLVHKMFGGGVVKVSDITLTQAAIEGYLTLGYAFIMQQIIDKKKRNGELDVSYLIAGAIQSKELEIKKVASKRYISLEGLKIMRLDNAAQIIGFDNVEDDCGCGQKGVQLSEISYVQPDEAKFYQGTGYSGLFFYTFSGNNIVIYNIPDCLNKVVLNYVSDASEVDIPEDVCLQICKVSFPDIFGVKKFDRPKIDDYSNPVVENLKLQIASQS